MPQLGVIEKVPGVCTGPLPIFYPDQIMSPGTVFLFDMRHKVPAGLTDQTKIKNVAWSTAKTLIGSGDEDSLSFTINRNAAFTGSVGFAEITPKLGLHTAITQTSAHTVLSQNFLVSPAAAIISYMLAHKTDSWFFSVWQQKTRLQISGNNSAMMAFLLNNTANLLTGEFAAAPSLAGSPAAPNRRSKAADNTSPYIMNTILATGATGAPTNVAASGNAIIACGGVSGSVSGELAKMPSFVTYRVVAENLTASGRSYATVDSIDFAMWTSAFSPGGDFYGDTYTAPLA